MTECINAGAIIVGNTLEDLCSNLGWDYESVQAQVDSYNANVENNAVTDEYGRKLFTIKQEKGPWYAIPRTPSIHHTMGGVVINTSAQVLDAEGNVISGLYAGRRSHRRHPRSQPCRRQRPGRLHHLRPHRRQQRCNGQRLIPFPIRKEMPRGECPVAFSAFLLSVCAI